MKRLLRPFYFSNSIGTKTAIFYFLIFILFQSNPLFAQKSLPANFCISANEKQMFDKINEVRKAYKKKPLKLSASLSYVAKVHVNDLIKNNPDTSVCNLSSWSDKGNWKACCYNPYVVDQECMWDKPKELTPYPFRGYEIAGFFEEKFNADSVLELWTGEKEVMDMLLSENEFEDKQWVCLGVGMNGNYVSAWFGQRADVVPSPTVCAGNAPAALIEPVVSDSLTRDGYYLVFGSFADIQEAREALKKFRKDGFAEAGLLRNGEMTRTYLARYNDLKEAMAAKQQLPLAYREAWILKEH